MVGNRPLSLLLMKLNANALNQWNLDALISMIPLTQQLQMNHLSVLPLLHQKGLWTATSKRQLPKLLRTEAMAAR